jgi:hypothetical protein
MKKLLILVLSSDFHPYDKMIQTSLQTWDSIEVEGVETVFYCGQSSKPNNGKVIYMPVGNSLLDMGTKCLLAYEWALQSKEFDYVARVNASCYVDKNNLVKFIDDLPETNVFAGVETDSQNGFRYQWGGASFIISKDVLQKIVDNKHLWRHQYMEDEASSLLVAELGIPFYEGKSGSIDKMPDGWRCISYGGESISFTDFNDLKRLNHHFYRVKCDKDRSVDAFVMNELFNVLK